jgi:hypothetical protein
VDAGDEPLTQFSFETVVLYWRGPSPFFFAPVPQDHVEALRRLARAVTYGWGMIPVEATIGGVAFTTSLFPKDDTYLLPLKDAVRRNTNITAGDRISVAMSIQASERSS